VSFPNKTDLMNWEAKRNSILGNEETPDTLKFYERRSRNLKLFPRRFKKIVKSQGQNYGYLFGNTASKGNL